ncbi:uncharacterized protein BJ171DRAFT_578601 [Polychytrium aggregatum]|uniref:uncharacterized protein n=1 Tax=Polychytrium aggregatum TaxID=110093 RepID=UPI0022FF245E|nr:uncharacterized protein BJ171DRAFT_578601 [Polychytrium aggregatum]KAI9207482.1 hypothetical protein BJ171DRAFT_578601 [Polychytrium aggregatum]
MPAQRTGDSAPASQSEIVSCGLTLDAPDGFEPARAHARNHTLAQETCPRVSRWASGADDEVLPWSLLPLAGEDDFSRTADASAEAFGYRPHDSDATSDGPFLAASWLCSTPTLAPRRRFDNPSHTPVLPVMESQLHINGQLQVQSHSRNQAQSLCSPQASGGLFGPAGEVHDDDGVMLRFESEDMQIRISRGAYIRIICTTTLTSDQCGLVTTTANTFGRSMTLLNLSPDAYRVLTVPNAGGDSVLSEAFSCELMVRMLGARLTWTEMEVRYFPMGGAMTDYIVRMGSVDVAVSVTRAMAWNKSIRFTHQDAYRLLVKKLTGIIFAGHNLMLPDRVDKHILHILTPHGYIAKTIKRVWAKLPPHIRASTMVVVTVSNCKCIFKKRRELWTLIDDLK